MKTSFLNKYYFLSLAFLGLVSVQLTAQPYDVVWTDVVGCSVSGNSLTKTAARGWGNAGAASEQVLAAGEDGWVEMTTQETNKYRMFGLSISNSNSNYNTINYAMYPATEGRLQVYENGVKRGDFGSYASGDRLRVERTGASITYKKNGAIVYTSTISSSGQLVADVALYTTGATIANAIASFSASCISDVDMDGVCTDQDCNDNDANFPKLPGTTCDDGDASTSNDAIQQDGCTCQGTVPGSKNEGDIIWIDVVGVSVSGNSLTKTAAKGWGNAGAASEQVLSTNTDGWVEMIAQETNKYRMFGLSISNSNSNYNTINYAMYPATEGRLQVYENGVKRGDFGSYASGDRLRVERTGASITYKKNGAIVYTSTISSSGQLVADVALYTTGATIVNAKYCFGSNDTEGGDGSSIFVEDDNSGDGAIRYSGGKVIIGASSTNKEGNYRLYVEGGILTELAKVAIRNSENWADDVFDQNYNLRAIEEVAAFIRKNKHLPNVPSAKEVARNGIDLAKMDATLLRQIEELWLHLIELKKENEQLKIRLEKLEK